MLQSMGLQKVGHNLATEQQKEKQKNSVRNINDWLGKLFKNYMRGTSPSVQWLRLFASMAGGLGSILGWGTKILNASSCSQKKKDVHERT